MTQPDAHELEAEIEELELVSAEQSAMTLFRTNDPDLALARMVEVSNTIVDVIEQQRFYATISGKKYVTCPGWKTAGGMLGLSPYTVWTRPNESQDGYVARVEIRILDERTIAAAEAECARDEPHWKTRPKHALRSMAETRATSRALRGPLEQVFALGGYEGTAAEEMPADRDESVKPSSPVEGAEPSAEQREEIKSLVRVLARIHPDVDWSERCREIAGVPARLLTHGGADYLIGKLRRETEKGFSADA
jgi:hypothetical protein